MKSLFLTAFLSMGVAHTGAFLEVWELPHVRDHFTWQDLKRKLNNTFELDKKADSLRNARYKAAEKNYALYKPARAPKATVQKTRYAEPWQKMGSKSTTRR